MQYRHHFELKFQVLIVKVNGLLCIVQLLLWHAINKGILIDWSTIYVVSVLICNEIIIMQRLGACNFLKCSSNRPTLIPINYVISK